MKRTIIVVLAVTAIAMAVGWLYFKGKTYEHLITQTQIDSELEKKFPVTKTFLIVFKMTFSNPEVTLLEESDRVGIKLDTELNLGLGADAKKLSGHVALTSGLAYRSETHEFFLADAQFDRLELEGIPQEHLDKVTDFVTKFVQQLVDKYPVYRLEAKDTKSTVAKMILKDVQIENQVVKVTLGL